MSVSRTGTPGIDDVGLKARAVEILDRWPSAGVADVASRAPVTQDTVFRIGSVTKTITAIAVMQLREQGLVDLDAPASDYLRSFRLIPAKESFRPATVRHLLTHTAGIGYWRRLSDLLQPGIGSGVRAGRRPPPPLADYYRKGLPVEVEPGTKWVYSNHGFAVLGQIVADVTGQPLARYLRDQIFEPLGMAHTDLIRSDRVRPGLATGYVLRSRGLKPVADREVPAPGGGGLYSTAADMARYISALLRKGAGEHGPVLKPETLTSMFRPHFQPDPRLPGMGLAFELGEQNGHKTVGKTGIVSGFLSAMVLAPDDATGVFVLSNTGGLSGRGAPAPLAPALLRRVLGLPDEPIRTGLPARPETWSELCGWYSPEPGPVTNLFLRPLFGAGVEVTVRGGHLVLRPLTPVPAMRRGLRLYPDDPDDPQVFRVESPEFGMCLHVAFTGQSAGEAGTPRLVLEDYSFRKRPEFRNPRRLVNAVAATSAAALAVRHGVRHGTQSPVAGREQG
jgi:CubicO group peptidase (beta-lactamase class C family)